MILEIVGGVIAVGVGIAVYAFLIEPQWFQVRHVRLPLPNLPREFEGYRIAQISDLHIDSWLGKERLEYIVELVNKQKPDLVVITGDFVSWEIEDAPRDLPDVLGALRAPDGVLGIVGNHDFEADAQAIRQIMREASIRDLNNDVAKITRSDAVLYIAGVDDSLEGSPDLDAVASKIPAGSASILLAHEPDFADKSAAVNRFGAQFSGHSHGGQIKPPFLGPVHLPKGGEKYPLGMYQVNGMTLYVNRGVGMVQVKARFNCRPEITIFSLQPRAGY